MIVVDTYKLIITDDGTVYVKVKTEGEALHLQNIYTLYWVKCETEPFAIVSGEHLISNILENHGTIVYEADKLSKGAIARLLQKNNVNGREFTRILQEVTSVALDRLKEATGAGHEETLDELYDWANDISETLQKRSDMTDEKFYQFVDEYVDRRLFNIEEKDFQWNDHAILNLQYIMAFHPMADWSWLHDFEQFKKTAMRFTLWERKHYPNGYEGEGDDYETAIELWLKTNMKVLTPHCLNNQ